MTLTVCSGLLAYYDGERLQDLGAAGAVCASTFWSSDCRAASSASSAASRRRRSSLRSASPLCSAILSAATSTPEWSGHLVSALFATAHASGRLRRIPVEIDKI